MLFSVLFPEKLQIRKISRILGEGDSSVEDKMSGFSLHEAVLPSRSALSDLGLIADLFEKMLLNWSSFCLKSLLFGFKSPKSLIFTFLAFLTKQQITCKISLNIEYVELSF